MAAIQPIASGESGASTRSKMNQAINKANQVDNKADQADLDAISESVSDIANALPSKADKSALADLQTSLSDTASEVVLARGSAPALADRIGAQDLLIAALYPGAEERPGDARSLFTSTVAGSAKTLPPIAIGSVVAGENGAVLRVPGSASPVIVASRQDFAVEPGQVYAARWAASRAVNTSDPYGDAVEFRLAWLDANKGYISTVLVDKRALIVADGRFVAQATFSRDQLADIAAPASARYARPYVRILGGDGVTDVEVIRRWETNGLPGGQGVAGREPEYQLDPINEQIRWRQADGSWGPWLDIGSARKKAEAARDIAAGYASDISTRSDTVPIYATVLGMSALSLPAGLNSFETRGYAQPGDFGGWTAVEIPIISADKPWNVVTNNGTRRWELRTDVVWLEMLGGKADAVRTIVDHMAVISGTDNGPAMAAALEYNRANVGGVYGGNGVIQFGFGKYGFQSRIKVKTNVLIRGIGGQGLGNAQIASQLFFPGNCEAIQTFSSTTIDLDTGVAAGTDAGGTIIENLAFVGGRGTDRTKHCIRMRARTICRGLKIESFAGNAYDIRSNGTGEGASNINNWEIHGGRTSGCLNGIHARGGDANNGIGLHVDNSAHLQCGILDRSFLGNYYYACHENGCGTLAKVTHNGQKYYAAQVESLFDDPSPLSTTEPGTNSAVWVPTTTTASGFAEWVQGGEYYPAGQKVSLGNNAKTVFFGGYSETGYAPSYVVSPGAMWGGFNNNAGPGSTFDNLTVRASRGLEAPLVTGTYSNTSAHEGLRAWNNTTGARQAQMGLYSGSIGGDGVTPRGAARMNGVGSSNLVGDSYFSFDYWDGAAGAFSSAFVFNRTGIGKSLSPGVDNSFPLGQSSYRWSQLYAGTGTINTSDERTKQQIEEMPDEWLDAWCDVQWCRFKFNDAVVEKGEDGARWHFGLIAQRVADVFVEHGIDPYAAGLVCYDEWEEEREEITETVTIPAVTEPTFRSAPILDDQGLETGDFAQEPGEDRVIEEERVEEIHTGEFRVIREAGDLYGIRYEEAFAIEAAFNRRRADRSEARLAQLEARLIQVENQLAA